jgi:hypothetical protein
MTVEKLTATQSSTTVAADWPLLEDLDGRA